MIQEDDVFQKAFLQGVIFKTSVSSLHIEPEALEWLQNIGMRWYYSLPDLEIPLPGPYILLHGKFHRPHRIYKDKNDAFVTAVGSLRNSGVPVDNRGGIEIAVSSRTEARSSEFSPLAGFRVAVKDNFDIQETKTSLCSRSYLNLYPK